MRILETNSTAPGTYFFNTNGKSGIVWGFAVAGVCFPLVNSLTLSET
jgi:hypothetical protein